MKIEHIENGPEIRRATKEFLLSFCIFLETVSTYRYKEDTVRVLRDEDKGLDEFIDRNTWTIVRFLSSMKNIND
jgi:hypothetical protein